jgi:hypothetical protein
MLKMLSWLPVKKYYYFLYVISSKLLSLCPYLQGICRIFKNIINLHFRCKLLQAYTSYCQKNVTDLCIHRKYIILYLYMIIRYGRVSVLYVTRKLGTDILAMIYIYYTAWLQNDYKNWFLKGVPSIPLKYTTLAEQQLYTTWKMYG